MDKFEQAFVHREVQHREAWPETATLPSFPEHRSDGAEKSAMLKAMAEMTAQLKSVEAKIDALLTTQASGRVELKWYTPAEFGEVVGKTRYTVSEWCRLNRVNASKAVSGRGRSQGWRISHEELERYRREGLLSSKYADMSPGVSFNSEESR